MTGSFTLWWLTAASSNPALDPLYQAVKAFNKRYPNVTVKMNRIANDPYKTALPVAMAGGHPPDVFFTWTGYSMLIPFAQSGYSLDLTPYYHEYGWAKRFYRWTLDASRYNGHLYALPNQIFALVVFTNKKLFQQLRVPLPTSTMSWQQVMNAFDAVKKHGTAPLAFGNLNKWPGGHFSTVFLAQFVDPKTRAEIFAGTKPFNTPAAVKGMESLQSLATKYGLFQSGFNGLTNENAQSLFIYKKGSAHQEGTWITTYWKQNHLDAGWFFWPPAPGSRGVQTTMNGVGDGFGVSRKAKDQKAIVAFLDWWVKEGGLVYSRVGGSPNANLGVNKVRGIVDPENVQVFNAMDKLKDTIPYTEHLIRPELVDLWLNNIQAMLGGSMSAKQALDSVEAKAAKVFHR
jgi:raffinose/stachyose/melibiose transport system substrate-binding protein